MTEVTQEGQGMMEYAIVIALVAVVVIAVILLLGPAIRELFETVVEAF